MVKIKFPDGAIRSYESGLTPYEIASSISSGLARSIISSDFNGQKIETTTQIFDDGNLTFYTWKDNEGKEAFWHSTAHLLAQVLEEFYDGIKLTIGPAISILMDGYVEKNKVVSLRGTLVPATTINKAIGSIPLLGKILVGSKAGEGVFGVSFKIKGPPKDLQTTVNPIKTLTPRFITRTLEKIKKN